MKIYKNNPSKLFTFFDVKKTSYISEIMTSFLFATLSLCQPEFHSSHHILKVADTRQIHFGNEILNQMKMCVTLQKHLFKKKKKIQ